MPVGRACRRWSPPWYPRRQRVPCCCSASRMPGVAELAAPSPALRHRLPDRLDWYTLRSLFGPLVLCLCVLLLAMLLQWSLRLFDMAASTGASMLLVLKM